MQLWFKEDQLPSSLATKCESRKRKKVNVNEGDNNEYNVEKSRPLKSGRAQLQKNKNCVKNQEESNFLFTNNNDDIYSYSYGDQTDTVKVMIGIIFWIS